MLLLSAPEDLERLVGISKSRLEWGWFFFEQSVQPKRLQSSEQNEKTCERRLKSLVSGDLVMGGGVSSGALRRCESHMPSELHKTTKRIRFMTEKGRFCRASWRRSGQTSIQKQPKFRVSVLLIYKPS